VKESNSGLLQDVPSCLLNMKVSVGLELCASSCEGFPEMAGEENVVGYGLKQRDNPCFDKAAQCDATEASVLHVGIDELDDDEWTISSPASGRASAPP
jgi:hypothetical protein